MLRWGRSVATLGLAAALCLASAGCAGPQARPTPRPSATTTRAPVFTSDAEATSAAKALYAQYLLVGQQVSEDGGKNVERYRRIVSATEYADAEAGAKYLQSRGLRSIGPTRLQAFRLQRADLVTGNVSAYACIDLADVRVVDSNGKDLTPATRPNKQTFLPEFGWRSGRFIVEKNGTWSGTSIC